MNKLIRKSAPVGVMAALTIWCCWSQLRDAKPLIAATDDEKLPRIERNVLRPEISQVSSRDPFLQYKPEPDPVEATETAIVKPLEPEIPPVDPQVVLRSISLGAIVTGGRRLSSINGSVYGEGDTIQLESFPDTHIRVQEIRENSILLEIEDTTVELKHGSAKVKPVVAPAPAARKLPSLDDIGRMITGSLVPAASQTDADADAESSPDE